MSSFKNHKSLFISLALLVALMMGTGVYLSSSIFALHGAAEGIEMDGNILNDDAGEPGLFDWDDLFTDGTVVAKPVLEGGIPGAFVGTVFERDFVVGKKGPDLSTFATGSKDTLDITPGWECAKDNNVNDKTDIVNAYATQYTAGGTGSDVVLYFGMERYSNDGAGNVGFWFLKDDVDCTAAPAGDGSFSGVHKDGDILVVSEFTVGGVISTINAYVWDISTGTLNPTPVASGSGSGGDACDVIDAADAICAQVNTVKLVGGAGVPWYTETKKPGNAPSNDLDVSEFFEGGLNLTKLGLDNCFATFIGVTRSSPSLTATLFDYSRGDFDTCGKVTIKKVTKPASVTGVTFTYGATGSGVAGFSLDTDGATGAILDTKVFDGLSPGVFTFAEDIADAASKGFLLRDLTCTNAGGSTPASGLVFSTGTGIATITLVSSGDVTCTYTNERLVKLIVLTCNTATERLIASEVNANLDNDANVDGGELTTTTISPTVAPFADAVARDAYLCSLPGANYDNLLEKTYAVSVEIPTDGNPSTLVLTIP